MKTINSALVSIIIPVYNVEDYLSACVNSLLTQSHAEIEVILVDDGSTDSSGQICKNFAERDSRVRVIHKKNSGSSDSRNIGLDSATGQYIAFVDSDDLVESDYIKVLLGDALATGSDISVCGFRVISSHSEIKDQVSDVMPQRVTVLDDTRALSMLMYQKLGVTNSPWAKIFSRELFEGIRFPSGKINQDLGTIYKLFAKAQRVVIGQKQLYLYLQRPGSVINSPFSAKRMAGLEFASEQLEFIKDHYPSLTKAAKNRLFMEAVYIAISISRPSIDEFKEYWDICKGVLTDNANTVLLDPHSTLQSRMYAAGVLGSPLNVFRLASLKSHVKSRLFKK